MNTHSRPWLQCVELHPDVLSDDFSEDIFALDLGTLSDYLIGKEQGRPDAELGRVPAVYRDADSFFAASYLTSGLKSLLEDVLGRLAGAAGNRVLRLQTPFGGGKSHTLAALLHAARSRAALDALPEAAGLPRPEGVRVAVIDGQFFDPTSGKRALGEDITARTLWGWIAWALGGREGYQLVRAQDEARVAPGGDALVDLLKGGPSLILLDELLQYLISAGGIRVEQTTLRDETLSFLQRLTAAVGGVDDAVLVYSLQSSKRESLEYTSLLQIVEHLAARKDQRREPVEGNEILNVIQRRLLAGTPDASAAVAAAEAHGSSVHEDAARLCAGRGGTSTGRRGRLGAPRTDQGVLPVPPRPDRPDAGALGGPPGLPAHPRRSALPRLVPARRPPRGRLPPAARPRRRSGSRERRAPRLLQGGRPARGLSGVPGARLRRRQRARPAASTAAGPGK